MPSASFFDMIDAEIKGIDSTVAVASRSAYRRLSAGAISAASIMVTVWFPKMIRDGKELAGYLNIALTLFVVTTVGAVVLLAAARWVGVLTGKVPVRGERHP